MNFIHASDFHLGYAQYVLIERFRDYARAFHSVIQYAIDHRVEFILISGDLFPKRNINAPTYEQAYKVLSELKDRSPYKREMNLIPIRQKKDIVGWNINVKSQNA
jgi:exonuclease SbcD